MTDRHTYSIAGFDISVIFPSVTSTSALLPWFMPFELTEAGRAEASPLTALEVIYGDSPFDVSALSPLTESYNDLGYASLFRVAEGYLVEIRLTPRSHPSLMLMRPGFASAQLWLPVSEPFPGHVISSMLRILFSQAIIRRDALLIHASAVDHDGRAVLFMGKSGTGKSTHSSLWIANIPGTELLNDDNPALRLFPDGSIRAYGTPWSGKTPCYRADSYPLAALIRLRQAADNEFALLDGVDAFVAILPGVSVMRNDSLLFDEVCSLVMRLASTVTVGLLSCRPDADAARLSHSSVFNS